MSHSRLSHIVSIALFIMLTSTFVSLSTRTDAWAIALGAGDYEFTTGDLSGGTFTIDGSGAFSAWNITFPATSISDLINFQSPTPTPRINPTTSSGSNEIKFGPSGTSYGITTRSDPNPNAYSY